jgi:hypothetical protein
MVFLSISRGLTPSSAQPLLVTSDEGVVRAAVEAATRALLGNLEAGEGPPRLALLDDTEARPVRAGDEAR